MTNQEKIEALIAQTKDPVQQATLLVLSKIDVALDANTEATERIAISVSAHREEFRLHDKEELKRMSAMKGAWWAGVLIIGAINSIGGYLLSSHVAQNAAQDSAIMLLKERMAVMEARYNASHPSVVNGEPSR